MNMQDGLLMLYEPPLQGPVLIAGFGGWPNAGEVSSWVLSFLIQSLEGSRFAEIRSQQFFDLVQQRPVVAIQGGKIQSVEFPCGVFYFASSPTRGPKDLIFFLGQEPHLCWPRFSDLFLGLAEKIGVTEIITIGGLYDNIPHTVEPRVSGITNDEKSLERFSQLRVRPAHYEGPMSIHTHLLIEAAKRGIPAISLWGHVPYYIQSNNAKTSLAILERLQSWLGTKWDIEQVRKAAHLLDEEVTRIVREKPELRFYIENLEREFFQDELQGHQEKYNLRRPPEVGDKVIRIDPFLKRG